MKLRIVDATDGSYELRDENDAILETDTHPQRLSDLAFSRHRAREVRWECDGIKAEAALWRVKK